MKGHEEKYNLLRKSYKERLGTKEFQNMHFDLQSVLRRANNLEAPEEPFIAAEIQSIISKFPTNKSPEPYGFNGDSLKKCWPIIANNFIELISAFYDGEICMKSINASFITLVLKKDSPLFVNDFRPISLLHSSLMLITKLLANRL